MATIFVARYLPGIGIARLFLGKPALVTGGELAVSRQVVAEFRPGQCFGALWYWHERRGRALRVVAIGRCVEGIGCDTQLPGIRPNIELRVLVEQINAIGREGPVDHYLRMSETAGEFDAPLPQLGVTAYLHLRPRLDVRTHTLTRMHEIFGPVPRTVTLPVSRLGPNVHANGSRRLQAYTSNGYSHGRRQTRLL